MCGCVQSLPALCVTVYEVFLHFVWQCTKSSCTLCGCVQSFSTCVAVYEVFLHPVLHRMAVYEVFLHPVQHHMAVYEVFLRPVLHHMTVYEVFLHPVLHHMAVYEIFLHPACPAPHGPHCLFSCPDPTHSSLGWGLGTRLTLLGCVGS